MGLTREEQETIINFNNAESTANIYTCNRGLMKKLQKAKWATFISSEKLDGEICSMSFEVSKTCIKIRPKRILSPKQLEASKKAIQKAQEKRKTLRAANKNKSVD